MTVDVSGVIGGVNTPRLFGHRAYRLKQAVGDGDADNMDVFSKAAGNIFFVVDGDVQVQAGGFLLEVGAGERAGGVGRFQGDNLAHGITSIPNLNCAAPWIIHFVE